MARELEHSLQGSSLYFRALRGMCGRRTGSRISSPSRKVFFAPFASENPYLQHLGEALGTLGVETTGRQSWWILWPAIRARAQIVHLQWLDIFFARRNLVRSLVIFTLYVLQLLLLRATGVKIFWTVHNLRSHERRFPLLDRMCSAVAGRLSNGIFVHCEWAKSKLLSAFPWLPPYRIIVAYHPSYIGSYSNSVSKTAARSELGVNGERPVFLFLGAIRPYKGVLELVDAFVRCGLHERAALLIAGKPQTTKLASILQEQARTGHNIYLHLDFIANNRIQLFMNAADVVVFPYRDIFTSGAALLAMSFGKAIIAPRIGCISEVLEPEGAYLYDRESPNGLTNAISRAAMELERLPAMGLYNLQRAKEFTWRDMAKRIAVAYGRSVALEGTVEKNLL
jgi:beta-1,4-mannosyltransferase